MRAFFEPEVLFFCVILFLSFIGGMEHIIGITMPIALIICTVIISIVLVICVEIIVKGKDE